MAPHEGRVTVTNAASFDVPFARARLQKLLREVPDTSFRPQAIGWLARCDYLEGKYIDALRRYLTLLADNKCEDMWQRALESVRMVEKKLKQDERRKLDELLIAQPRLLSAYLYFQFYHQHDAKPDLLHLTKIAERATRSNADALADGVTTRLAELAVEQGNQHGAVRFAAAVIQSRRRRQRSSDDHRLLDRALWSRAAAQRKLKKPTAAIRDFEAILKMDPPSQLEEGARENLALLYEETGQLGKALDQYYELDYKPDIAFMLDVRMTPEQIKQYIARNLDHPQRDVLVYTLGVRYLRANRLAQARDTLALVRGKLGALSALPGSDPMEETIHWPEKRPVPNQLRAARTLLRLHGELRRAHGREAKARATYALASHIYNQRNLLYYNAALWRGERAFNFCLYWDDAHDDPPRRHRYEEPDETQNENVKAKRVYIDRAARLASEHDSRAVVEHMYSHECVARARALCLEILRKYPQSSVAPQAMYRAACADYWLSRFNDWWRNEDKRKGFSQEAIRLMEQLPKRFPKHPLAQSAAKHAEAFVEE